MDTATTDTARDGVSPRRPRIMIMGTEPITDTETTLVTETITDPEPTGDQVPALLPPPPSGTTIMDTEPILETRVTAVPLPRGLIPRHTASTPYARGLASAPQMRANPPMRG